LAGAAVALALVPVMPAGSTVVAGGVGGALAFAVRRR
jgi:hypothetical protein